MFPTRALLSPARLTLFTRAGCGLCDTAKNTVLQLQKRRSFEYVEADIMEPGNKSWKDVYEFDVPVLHVQSVHNGLPKEATLSDARKLFHRWTEQELERSVDEVEKPQSS
jgi:glutaredoxin